MTEKPQASPAELARDRFRFWAENEFSGSTAATEHRVASALEFIAFRIGRIDDKLSELVDLLKKQQKQDDS